MDTLGRSLADLTEAHQEELKRYLHFFKLKREFHLKEVENIVNDFKEDRLLDDVFSKEEVETLIDNLSATLRNTLQTELQGSSRMSAIYVRQLLASAQSSNVSLHGDTGILEDQRLLEDVAKIESGKHVHTPSTGVSGASRLPTLQSAFNNDPSLLNELNEMKEKNRTLTERYQQMQQQLTALAKAKNDGDNTAAMEDIQQDMERLRLELERKAEMVEALNSEAQRKLNESTQFQQLKKMIQQKNDQLKDYRARLSRYEQVVNDE
eukprot:GILK01004545.1.p1 GENE.GILK01004545.1~~GILK01004545.1.p1  ORF type:complete len:276 (-),score=79.74 GILK01004545.1:138-932(-)